jgi:RNA polymerase sigma-70 factor, ECF subfamily
MTTPRWQLERYRPWLRLQARQMQLDPRLRRRFDGSDLVQEAMLRAHANLDGFRGTTEAELLAWLQQILGNALADEVRRARAKRRDVALERDLEKMLEESSARLEGFLTEGQPAPGEQAERHEQLLRLAAALDQLPEPQRDAVVQRDLLGASLAEAAEQLGRSERAVAGLLLRGRRKLRELLADEP